MHTFPTRGRLDVPRLVALPSVGFHELEPSGCHDSWVKRGKVPREKPVGQKAGFAHRGLNGAQRTPSEYSGLRTPQS